MVNKWLKQISEFEVRIIKGRTIGRREELSFVNEIFQKNRKMGKTLRMVKKRSIK